MQNKNKIDTVIYLQMRKAFKAKTPPSDSRFTTLKNPLLSQQVVTSKGISILYTNL